MMRESQQISIPFLPEKARYYRYENGYTFIYVPKQGDVFNISTWVRTGSIHEDDQISGISHFLEHLMFKGTKRFKPGEFDKKMESMGAIINAATWKDFTFYYITGPKGLKGENFDIALDMHADMMLHSTIPTEEVGPAYNINDPDYQGEKRERSVVIEEIGMREDQPWTKVYNSVNHMMYPQGHPYQRDVIGTRDIISQVPRDTIYDYYQSWYSPKNMTTIVVGDFDEVALEAKVLKHFDFSHLSHAAKQPLDQAPTISTNGKQYEEVTGDYQTSFFLMGFHGPRPQNLEESIALDVASYILGESRSARLTQALLEKPKQPIFNTVSSGQSTFKLGNVLFVQGNFTSPDTKGCLKQVTAEIEKLTDQEPITEEEFTRAVKKLKVDFAETSETASGIAETIGESLTVVGDLASYVDYLTTLSNLKRETVQAVAKKYLNLNHAYTSVLVPEHA